MKFLSEENISNKTVLLRCDFNVPVKNGVITDDSKISKSLDTINYLLKQNNRVIIFSHFGKVKSIDDKEKNTLYPIYEYLKKSISIEFIKDPLDLDDIKNSECNCFLVENTRYTDLTDTKESENNLKLASYWASFGDVFVVDAFASLHRAHSSTAGISKFLPTYLGFLVEKEIQNLKPLITNDKHPFLVIMGGAKVDDKIGIIKGLIEKCDNLIITGGILNTFLKIKGYNVGNSLVSEDEDVLNDVKDILTNYQDKIIYSEKFIVQRTNRAIAVNLEEIEDNDIIYDNLINLDSYINNAKIIFFNGTCGKFEDDNYKQGMKTLLNSLTKTKALVFIGGGDTASAVKKLGFSDKYTYISSGGGASLEYIAFNKLKALEYIKENATNNR